MQPEPLSHPPGTTRAAARSTLHQPLPVKPPSLLACPITLQELRRTGFEIYSVPRGGETTYHGPGQLVAYPIINLRQLGLGARAFVEGLEDAMVQAAGCFGIEVS